MKTYIIKVNGKVYEVEVQKKEGASATVTNIAPAAAPVPHAETKNASASGAEAAGVPVECGATGKIWKIVKAEGDKVAKGEAVVILESRKMEIPVVSPVEGTVTRVLVTEGSDVESGKRIALVEPK